jgi:hypothetical protein
MAFTNIATPNVGDPTKKQSFAQAVIDNLSYLYNVVLRVLSNDGFENGSFESDVDGDGIPDGWAKTLTGGTITLDNTAANVAHGLYSVKFVNTGAGGGYLQYVDYFEVTTGRSFVISWQQKSNIATVTNKIEILFYDSTKSFISTTTFYNASTGNPTAWLSLCSTITPPATSKYARLKITGVDGATAGQTWFDDFRIVYDSTNVPIGKQVFTATGSTNWTAPANVSRVRAIVIGGGGGGGGGFSGAGGAGGNGGTGAYVEAFINVMPGVVYSVTVGLRGTGGATGAAGTDGVDSSVGTLVIAGGGKHGNGGLGGGPGATGADGAITTTFPNCQVSTSSYFATKGVKGNGGTATNPGTNGTSGIVVLEW